MLWSALQVALGGALGAGGRYLVNRLAMHVLGAGFPWGTLAVNVMGSFAMGVVVVLLAHRGAAHLVPLLATGVLGGFTTFSAFSLDAVLLWERGESLLSLGYVFASVLLSIAALVAGLLLARSLIA